MSRIRYGSTSGGYRVHNTIMRDPILGLPLEDLAVLMAQAGSDLYLDARKANGISQGINSPLVNTWVDLTKNGNNATFQNIAGTTSDGWDLQSVVNGNGSVIDYSNFVTNANFVNTNNWSAQGSSLSVGSGKLIFTGNGTSANVRAYQDLNIKPANGKRLNIKCRLRVTTTGANSIQLFLRDGTSGAFLDTKTVNTPIQNQWYEAEFSVIATMPTLVNNLHLFVSHNYSDVASANGKIAELEKPQVIYLTDNSQVIELETQLGHQLTALECDRIFPFVATTGQTKVSARPFFKLDGADTVGIIPNNPSVDIVGLDEFEIDRLILTPSTIVFGYLISKNLENTTNLQYSVAILANGSIEARLNSNAYTVSPIGTIVANTVYNIVVKRQSGRLICLVNGVETYNQANVVSVVTQPNFRLGAISTNVGGTTHSTFSNVYTGILSIAKNPDFTKLSSAWAKVVKDYI